MCWWWGLAVAARALGDYGSQVAPDIAPRIMPAGTDMVSTAPLDRTLCRQLIPSNAAACDTNFVLVYFRFSADHRLLLGGRVSYTAHTPVRLEQLMAARLRQVLPRLGTAPIEHVWGALSISA
jgi:gamma-glutamylputrescine oxidase